MKIAVNKPGTDWYRGVSATHTPWRRSGSVVGFAPWQNPADLFRGPQRMAWAGGGSLIGMGILTYAVWLSSLPERIAPLAAGVMVGAQISGFLAVMITQKSTLRQRNEPRLFHPSIIPSSPAAHTVRIRQGHGRGQ